MSTTANNPNAFEPPTLESLFEQRNGKPSSAPNEDRDEFSPVSEAKWAEIKDSNYLSHLYRRGELRRYGGEYVLAYLETIVAHGPDLIAIRAEAAARLGVPESRLISIYVHPG